MSVCKECGYKHPSAAALCVNRFENGQKVYRAAYKDSPRRLTHWEAETDMCRYLQQTKRPEPKVRPEPTLFGGKS